jgi:hypothetical protein
MQDPPDALAAQAALERRVARLEVLVAQLMQQLNVRQENPVDKSTVTRKTRFDWQD